MIGFYFTTNGWADYIFWQEQDKKTLRKINNLIKDIARNGYCSLGKSEALKGNLSGFHSRVDIPLKKRRRSSLSLKFFIFFYTDSRKIRKTNKTIDKLFLYLLFYC